MVHHRYITSSVDHNKKNEKKNKNTIIVISTIHCFGYIVVIAPTSNIFNTNFQYNDKNAGYLSQFHRRCI